jgi:hypothetical protein
MSFHEIVSRIVFQRLAQSVFRFFLLLNSSWAEFPGNMKG